MRGGLGWGLSHDELILLFPGVFIFAFVSSQTEINEHFRYALPAFPYFFTAIAQIAQLAAPRFQISGKYLVANETAQHYVAWVRRRGSNFFASGRMASFLTTIVVSLGAWLATSSLWIYPHSLSYFNESIGGPLNGPRHLLGSNVDWGQDLRYLRRWRSEHIDATLRTHDVQLRSFMPVVLDIKDDDSDELDGRQSPAQNVPAYSVRCVNVLQDYRRSFPGGRIPKSDAFSAVAGCLLQPTAETIRIGYSILLCPIED